MVWSRATRPREGRTQLKRKKTDTQIVARTMFLPASAVSRARAPAPHWKNRY